jgi:enoyl-[acyl-carrier protein] reductase III
MDFSGKTILVTGSGRGIGRAIALHFARLGADLVINYFRNRRRAEETAAEIRNLGRQVLLVKANLGQPDGIDRLFSEIELRYGALDILVNNAASGYNRPAMEQRVKGWDWTMNINARAALFCSLKAVPLMEQRNGGYIVNISSPGSTRVLPDYVVVGASKAALEAVTRYLAVELSSKNIVVNAISPGVVLTEALKHFDASRDELGLHRRAIELSPAGRLVTPEEVAGVAAFLCSPQASMIRGQIIVVDGGATLPFTKVI